MFRRKRGGGWLARLDEVVASGGDGAPSRPHRWYGAQAFVVVRYCRLSCGCTLDLTQSEWDASCRLPDGYTLDCPKCSDKNVYIMATWKPGEVEGDWS